MADPHALAEGTLVAGKLRIVRRLGVGGMGAVYEVEHELTKHRRALKLLHGEMLVHPAVVARFEREASAAGRIANPHIVESFDAGRLDTGEPYLVMELLNGESLDAVLARKGRLSLAEIVDVVGQACDGVQAAHDAGIVHRDLKPENLFLIDRGGKPFVKILDFGISKFDPALTGGHGMTKEGSALGTPYYMSPEQVRGDVSLDARADVYALGVILYECASGRRPFDADLLTALVLMIHEGKPRPLAELCPDMPRPFADVVHRAMDKDRERRFVTARELGAALSAVGHAVGDTERPPPMQPHAQTGHARPAPAPAAPLAVSQPGASGSMIVGAAVSMSDEAKRAPKGRRGALVGAALGAAILFGGAAVAVKVRTGATGEVRADTPRGLAPSAVPAAAAPPILPAIDAAVAAAPSAALSVAVAAAPPAPHPASSASPAAASSTGGHARPASKTPGSVNRVDQKGLASDNPFR